MSNLGDPIIFWTLRLFLFAILLSCGYGISNSPKRDIGKYIWIAIISFALVEGLRWMRGTDYSNYLYMFETGKLEKDEPLYRFFVFLVHSIRLDSTLVFVFLSGFLMGSISLIFKVKELRVAAIWGLPLIYLMLGYNAENLVRQYFAISFLGLAYYSYCNEKIKWVLVCILIAPLIHFASLLGSILFLVFIIWKDIELKKLWIFVAIYLIAYFIWKPEWLADFAPYIGSLNVDGDFAMSLYIQDADRFFTEEGSISVRAGKVINRSMINIAVYFLTDLALIITGFFACQKKQKLVFLYYSSYIGILCQVLFGDIQLLMRFGYYFSWTCPILIALVAIYKDYGKFNIIKYVVWFLLLSRYALYGIFFQVGKIPMEEGCMFIWDK